MTRAWMVSAVALSALAFGCVEDAGFDPKTCSAPGIDTTTDPANCGECGHACQANEVCSAGECLGECPDGETACAGSCRDLASEASHCGGCDRPCADGFACVEGACVAENSGGNPSTDRRIRVLDGQFNVCGRPIYMNGANTPWHSWNDFGGEYDEAWWSGHYADLHDAGVNSSRVWITCNGEVGIDITPDGEVLGATPAHWENLDSFFAIAEERRIYVMATLMSFDHFKRATSPWQAWIASDSAIDSYIENYLLPFLDRYGENPYLWSIDLMNEPDWVHEQQHMDWDRLRAYFARAARAIHENSEVLVTVGMASPKYNAPCAGCEPAVTDTQLRNTVDDDAAYLDFYSPHYYDWVCDVWGNTLHMKPSSTNFPPDKPVTIGEHPAHGTVNCGPGSTVDYTLGEDLEAAFSNGLQGTLPWTSNGVDRNGGFSDVSAAASSLRDAHPTLVFPECP
ncbi:MAG TPA: hypothetical protein VF103_15790 [Polyangiaceae bacterium]